jgi:very-short-patch-repair endonuclease
MNGFDVLAIGYSRMMAPEDQKGQTMQGSLLGRKYAQLLGYIAELDRLRTTVVRSVNEHPSQFDLSALPQHPSVKWNVNDSSAFLVVTRPSISDSPPCPTLLTDWVHHRSNQINVAPSLKPSFIFEGEELKWDEDGPIESWNTWIKLWELWAEQARPAFAARELYVQLYDLHATLERSSDQLELVAADVSVALNGVDHPILITPVHVVLDVERSRITIGCQEEPSQVYGDAIRGLLPEVGDSIARARNEVEENPDIWAFGGAEVDLFAARFVQGADAGGQFVTGAPIRGQLTARRSPWLLLRKRATGVAELAEGLRRKFEVDGVVPKPIIPILVDRKEANHSEPEFRGEPDEDQHSFFTKPANAEQLAILRNFRRNGCVHVQGPPGTGKTHTIANLIGHFLAEGKSVLVTSEKAQSLTVLREKVVEELQPLCVSLAGVDSGEGFKAGMRGLYERLGTTEKSVLEADAERLTTTRNQTIFELKEARQRLREIIEREYLPIDIRGRRGTPAQAAKQINSNRTIDGWIPGEVLEQTGPPLSESEFHELLDLLAQFSSEVVPEVRKPLPPVEELPSPEDFRSLVSRHQQLRESDPPIPVVPVEEVRSLPGGPEAAKRLLGDSQLALERLATLSSDYRELANRAIETPSIVEIWNACILRGDLLLETEQRVLAKAAPYGFVFSGESHRILDSAKQLLQQVQKSGRPVLKPRLLNKSDKFLFGAVSSKRQFGDETSLAALIHQLEFEDERERFRDEIRAAALSHGLQGFAAQDAERRLRRDSSLQVALCWATDYYQPIVKQIESAGLGSEKVDLHVPSTLSGSGPTERMAWWLQDVVRPALVRYLHYREVTDLSLELAKLEEWSKEWQQKEISKPLRCLLVAVLERNIEDYKVAYLEVAELRAAAEPIQRRDSLLARLKARAEMFATSLEKGTFDMTSIRGTLDAAWLHCLIDQELVRRNSLSLLNTKDELDRLKGQLDDITVKLASVRAWAAQHLRVTHSVRRALSQFHEAQRKIGGGKGARVPELLRTMRTAMREAKDAFPVWIMPLHDLSRSFDFTQTQFDVVIVDESSQLSAAGLITLLIADSAIVVGDDEQTEPSLAGVPLDSVSALIREHLVDFNDGILWSPDSSLYSFAARFGATVGLREHFRCVPQIIAFSNKMCYDGKIQALRDSKGVVQLPHVVPISCGYDVKSTRRDVNEMEAVEIASLIVACSELPEYQGQTFGVIALRGSADARGGDPQCDRIVSLVRNALGAAEWERFVAKSKFKAGVPPVFQGDERDVVFISVGDDPRLQPSERTGPLNLINEISLPGKQYRKRLNVAVSRARNQVWIVHSFRHFEAELKDGDVRRRLFEFAYAPNEWLESTLAVNPKAESPFEQDVFADLVRLGFSVVPQVRVGQYRIDLVAEDDDARVAIECDGDAFHKDAAADLSRQIILERCGWKFVRVRGSEYYRDPILAIQRVVKELEKLGVTPSTSVPAAVEPEGALLQRVRSRAQELRFDVSAERPVNLVNGPVPDDVQQAPENPQNSSTLSNSANANEVIDNSIQEISEGAESELLGEDLIHASAPQIRNALTASSADDGLQADHYFVFSETGFQDPKVATLGQIESDLAKIIAVEGPATETTILDRYRVAVGYGRLKGPTREMILAALNNAVKKGLAISLPDYPGADAKIYLLPGQPYVRLRRRGPRDLADVPMGEIVEFVTRSISSGMRSEEADVFRAVLNFFDLKRLTEQARSRLGKAFEIATLPTSQLRDTLESDENAPG